ncbi:MAG TPA: thioredoxin domain-containing protein [Solirubrobacteraceae bacterium]
MAVVAIAVLVLIAKLTDGSGGLGTDRGAAKARTPIEASSLSSSVLEGVKQSKNVLGRSNAPITLQFFGNLDCAPCREIAILALRSIIQKWVATGKMRIEYIASPIATNNQQMFRSEQTAALAAGEQNKMWNFVEMFYYEQAKSEPNAVPGASLENFARNVPGLNLPRWNTDRESPRLSNQLAGEMRYATQHEVLETPSLLLGKTGGTMSRLPASDYNELSFDAAVERALEGK